MDKKYQCILYLNGKVLAHYFIKTQPKDGDVITYNGIKYRFFSVFVPACIGNSTYIVPCLVEEIGKVHYKWNVTCNDGSIDEDSEKTFASEQECYEDMRNAALEKMKWNTEFLHDFEDNETIGYEVKFSPRKITHNSYSGLYTYTMFELTALEGLQRKLNRRNNNT